MTTYTLTVNIHQKVYPILKKSYSLCIAKKVNNTYNVVWQAESFLLNNVFSWEENYQVYGVEDYTQGVLVVAQTNSENISSGETCTLSRTGIMNPATGAIDHKTSTFHVLNDYGTIRIGVKQAMIDGVMSPIFVSPEVVKSTVDLTPLVSVMVWFDTTLKTGSMFFNTISNTVEVPYNGSTSQTVTYTNKEVWIHGTNSQPKKMYSMTEGFSYIDSQLDPHVFDNSIRDLQISDIVNTQATTTSGFAVSPPMIECFLQFSTAADANNAWAYLKQKIMYNIEQDVPPKVDERPSTSRSS